MTIFTLIPFLPWVLTSAVLLGVALVGWRRTRATGALLVAVAALVQILNTSANALSLYWMTSRHESSMARGIGTLVLSGGPMVSSVLLIVGVALLMKRLPSAQRRA